MICRVFTTHEQLAVSEEREAELAAAVQEAKQSADAAHQALAANQQVVKPQPSLVLQDEQVSLSTWIQSYCVCRCAHPCTHPQHMVGVCVCVCAEARDITHRMNSFACCTLHGIACCNDSQWLLFEEHGVVQHHQAGVALEQ